MDSSPFWVSAFLDIDAHHWRPGLAFWTRASGTRPSPVRGDADQFTTLEPAVGDAHLRAQRVDDPGTGAPTRIHLDLHVHDPAGAAAGAEEAGARVAFRSPHGYVVLRSPGGLAFCFVSHPASVRSAPISWGSHRSALDQVCIDAPADTFDAEVAFWAAVTGWEAQAGSLDGFMNLRRPSEQPVRLLLQQVGDQRPAVGAHLDFACTDRGAEVERQLALGARHVADHEWWTVLADPSGAAYCVTDRAP